MFRSEVLESQQAQWMGTIRIARRPGYLAVSVIASILAIALVAFAVFGEMSRKTRAPGLLVPVGGLVQLAAPQAGRVAEVLVAEGDRVTAGQAVLQLRTDRALADGDVAELNRRALTTRRESLGEERRLQLLQADERRETLKQRLASLVAETAQAREELETIQQRVALARKSRDRMVALAAEGFLSTAQAQQKDEELLDLQGRERGGQRTLVTLEREQQTVRAELMAIRSALDTTLAQLDRGVAQLEQERAELEARAGLTITAPREGHVSALPVHAGQSVQAGQTLVTVAPHAGDGESNGTGSGRDTEPRARLTAQLYASSRAVGFIQPGQTVWLRYAAYPFQKFGMAQGQVLHVSPTPIAPEDLPTGQGQALVSAAQANEPLYRIDVGLERQVIAAYGRDVPLRAGMSLDADVTLEKRRIWEWLLEPLLATAKRV